MITAIHVELNVLCLLILCVIAYQSHRSVNQQMRRVLFRTMVYGVISQLALDTLWRLVEGRVFPGAVWINRVINALYLSAGMALACVWYLYVLETLGYKINRRLQAVVMLPGLALTLFNVVSVFTGWCFTVSEKNVYAHGDWYAVQLIGAYGMLLVSLAHIVTRLLRRDERVPRRTVYMLLGFYIIPLLGAIVSLFYTGMPGAWTCASISLMLMYIEEQDSEILRDGLTGLNNRKTLEGAYAEYVKQASAARALYLFMMDLDRFKQINDTLGHPVGDEALVNTAQILTRSMAGVKGIIARFGGDEFLIMGFFSGQDAAEAFRKTVMENFSAFNVSHHLPYRLAVSVGIAQHEKDLSLEELMNRADADLYLQKKKNKAGR